MWIFASSHATHCPFIQILLLLTIAMTDLASSDRAAVALKPNARATPHEPVERHARHGAGCGASILRRLPVMLRMDPRSAVRPLRAPATRSTRGSCADPTPSRER